MSSVIALLSVVKAIISQLGKRQILVSTLRIRWSSRSCCSHLWRLTRWCGCSSADEMRSLPASWLHWWSPKPWPSLGQRNTTYTVRIHGNDYTRHNVMWFRLVLHTALMLGTAMAATSIRFQTFSTVVYDY